jgi:nucleoside-diphosphate-sugar epimerase
VSDASSYAGARIIVLGATGFIGQWVARALAARGAELILVARNGAGLDVLRRLVPGAESTLVELQHPHSVASLLHKRRPAAVFNLAGYGIDPRERDEGTASATNDQLPRLLGDLMAHHGDPSWRGQQVVHAGSALEYGTASGDLREDTVCTPTTVYGITKLAGTTGLHGLAAASGTRAVTARLFTVYGRGEHQGRLLPTLVAASQTTDPIPLTEGLQQRDFTYVEDVVDGMLRLGLLPDAALGIVNVATSRLTTVREFVLTAARVLGIAAERLQFGAVPTRAEEMHHDPVNVDRLRALTSWVPSTTIADGIQRTSSGA